MLKESITTASARTASSTVLRMTTSPLSGCPDPSTVTKTGVSNPNSMSWLVIAHSSLRDEGPAACVHHEAFVLGGLLADADRVVSFQVRAAGGRARPSPRRQARRR